jgi:hypothetical protein
MDVVVDLGTGEVTLADADDLAHFAVQAVSPVPETPPDGTASSDPVIGPDPDGKLGALAAALAAHQVGHVDPDGSIRVVPDAVRRLAGSDLPVTDQWESGFRAMIDYAATRGWVADDGTIRAHVEWRSAW